MKHVVIADAAGAPIRADLVCAAARCWRTARDAGCASAPTLHMLLANEKCPMLAAAFDSVLHLYESTLGRDFVVGGAEGLSEDETSLANMLRTADRLPGCLGGEEGTAKAFDCALCSIRILLAIEGEAAQ